MWSSSARITMHDRFVAAMAREGRYVTGPSTMLGTRNPKHYEVRPEPWRGGNRTWESVETLSTTP
jgi:hypothetical protein